ncbi:class I SAM-dependent methyltransferase [Acaryochloris sp. IP29b_bin.148]|uniref:class I SAM-dependent methyltransferase n=1 Tax=Acaryochloris sp. IP29b_bin.148 TaxID=2969218 RepID=UPI00263287B4|nr:class I SAM-dependent methyltransferase [Acaryochloris sp. IP29b_bin.148]
MNKNPDETQLFWNRVADDWDQQVGDDGDSNRILNSDPVLWQFAGDVSGATVLDAGCGTGYLSRKLNEKGAHVIGIDFSEEMLRIARSKAARIDFRIDSCSILRTVADKSIDIVISNYVLMDTPDLTETVQAFFRVLKPGGHAVVVFSHPCFPQEYATTTDSDVAVTYQWDFSYFQQQKCIEPPWGHFTSEFIWFHRPLSDYWKAFRETGFEVVDFEEPRISENRYHLAKNQKQLNTSKNRPISVAFKLKKRRQQNTLR